MNQAKRRIIVGLIISAVVLHIASILLFARNVGHGVEFVNRTPVYVYLVGVALTLVAGLLSESEGEL